MKMSEEKEGKKKAIILRFSGIDSLICGVENAVILEERLPEDLEKKLRLEYIGEIKGVHVYKNVFHEGEEYINKYYNVTYG